MGGVEDEEGDGGAGGGGAGALDADGFDGVGGVAQSGGVDEAEEVVADFKGVFDGVAGGAVDVADYGAFFAEEAVEER